MTPYLLAFELLRQLTLEALPFSGFQEKGVLLHILNDAFLLDLPLETAKGALHGFALEQSDFCQNSLREILRSNREYERHMFGKQQWNVRGKDLTEFSVLHQDVVTGRNCSVINEIPVNTAAAIGTAHFFVISEAETNNA